MNPLNPDIPVPTIAIRFNESEPVQILQQGEFVNAVRHIFQKFNFNNGENLHPFRHNLRPYYNEAEPITRDELNTIRGLLSDRQLLICVTPPGGNWYRWDNRSNPVERKVIYIEFMFYVLLTITLSDVRRNAARLIFMDTLLHGLGDYITTRGPTGVNLNPDDQSAGVRPEGGTKTEYAFFGGIMEAIRHDYVHYESVIITLFPNSQSNGEHWYVLDQCAMNIWHADRIQKLVPEMGLRQVTDPNYTRLKNTVQQLGICCAWHRIWWTPFLQSPRPDVPGQYGGGQYVPGQYGQQYQPGYPQQQYQHPSYGYGAAPGVGFGQGHFPHGPPPTGNVGFGQIAFPPAFGTSFTKPR